MFVLRCNSEDDVETFMEASKDAGIKAKRVVTVSTAEDDREPVPDLAKAMHAVALIMSVPQQVAFDAILSATRLVNLGALFRGETDLNGIATQVGEKGTCKPTGRRQGRRERRGQRRRPA